MLFLGDPYSYIFQARSLQYAIWIMDTNIHGDADFMLKRDFWMQILWSQGIAFLSILIQFINYAKWNA